MRKRPRDFYGPEDWWSGDPELQEAKVRRDQAEWDKEFAALPWWKRLVHILWREA